MSSKVGKVYFAREKRSPFLDMGMEGSGEYSDSTAELIDHEVRNIINEQYEKALEILKGQKDILAKGAKILLDKEKIEGGELKTLMEKSPKKPSA